MSFYQLDFISVGIALVNLLGWLLGVCDGTKDGAFDFNSLGLLLGGVLGILLFDKLGISEATTVGSVVVGLKVGDMVGSKLCFNDGVAENVSDGVLDLAALGLLLGEKLEISLGDTLGF